MTWEIGITVETHTYLRVYDGSGCLVYPRATCTPKPYVYDDYFLIEPDPDTPDTFPEWTADLNDVGDETWDFQWQAGQTELLTLEFSTSDDEVEADVFARYVYVPGGGVPTQSETFYLPSSKRHYTPDVLFRVIDESDTPIVKVKDFEDMFPNGYVVPYDCLHLASCPVGQGTANPTGAVAYFLTPVDYVPSATSGRTFTFASEADATVHDLWSPTWDIPNLELKFPQGRKLIVEGELEADGVTFTEAEAGQGWGGIVLEGATADLDGVTVEHAETGISAVAAEVCSGACYALESTLTLINSVVRESVGDGVVVYNSFNDPVPGSVTIQGSDLTNNGGNGLFALYTPSTITVEPNPSNPLDRSNIRSNGQSGVLADQAEVILNNAFVESNGGSGVEAVSSGRVYVFESTIQNNARYGAEATNYGEVVFTRPGTAVTSVKSLVQLNAGGGLFAERYGSINAGTANSIGAYGGSCTSACSNTIQLHATEGAPFDVSAESGSTVYAQLDWWGMDVDDSDPDGDLVLVSDAGSLIEVVPSLDAPPGSGSRPSAPQALAPSLPADGSPAERSGDPEREALRTARVAAAEGAYTRAFGLLRDVIVTSETPAYRRLAYTEATRLMRQAQPTPVVTFLEGVAEGNSAYRPWALRALVVAYQASDRLAEAEAAAGVLAAEYGTEGHARYGQLATVRLRLFAGDLAGAQAALALAEGAWPGHPEVVETARVVALVEEANSEPESSARSGETVGGTLVGGGAAARGASEGTEEIVAGEAFTLAAPYPNPSRGSLTLPITVAETADVRVAVYDVLGREVAVVHEGPLAAGQHALTLDGSRLPSGVYVVRAEVGPCAGASGGASAGAGRTFGAPTRTLSRRFVLTR